MESNKPPVLKTLVLAYCAVGAFTVISILGPIILGYDRKTRKYRG